MHIDPDHLVTDANALQALYGSPGEASLKKEVDHVHPHYRAFIEASPFAMLATCGPDGLDASPRGDPAGLVVVEDEKTLLLPDRRGNNRVDSLLNVLADPRVALLFLVPGVGETLRVNGTARISVDPALLARFAVDDKLPRSVLIVDVQTVYFQCSRALLRSRLWDPATQVPRSALPSVGRILSDLTAGTFDGVTYDRDLPARVAGTLY
ncbi:pyridoxamine 5'-phosphate oxidase family protein [Achromobacter piechaudii]|uniref:PPOX class probable FMN-dependent enzyme, DR_2398 family n=1 Tax=Achromobacter piechaudii ATCC 43553 TaxID=742159 RepID=D4X4H6_9BURK|nr:pyridoxamine 5'-phosphate oxidase family protein [Achromobacter piechaudii]EFF78148.1 PPOX class probable FMN-dependent enzyme, DR_2398 family [Achromobacter piechaudii ATCC 43553]